MIKIIVLIFIGAIASYEDIRNKEISNKILLAGFISGGIIGIWDKNLPDAFIGSVIMAAPLYAMAYAFMIFTGKQGLGGGDVKIAAVYGFFLQCFELIFAAYLIAFTLAGIFLILYKILNRKRRNNYKKSGMPLIPFISIGAISVYVIQNII